MYLYIYARLQMNFNEFLKMHKTRMKKYVHLGDSSV